MDKAIYFDNAATTPLSPEVLEKMLPWLKEDYGNASSVHSFGRRARVVIEEARETVAKAIGARPKELFFVSGGTEANNFLIRKIAETTLTENGRNLVISDMTEHPSVLETLKEVSSQGLLTTIIPPEKNGFITAASLREYLNTGTSLVSVMHVNNETGCINDVRSLAVEAHSNGSYFHCDAVQSFGKLPLDVTSLGVDALSISSHKIYGPKGIGAAYVKAGTPVRPFIRGGHQERNMRGGTENVAAIAGFAEAVRLASTGQQENFKKALMLKETIIKGLQEIDAEGIGINSGENTSPYILSVTFRSSHYRIDPESVLMFLDINGLAVSNGSACSSGSLHASHVLISMGMSEEDIRGTIRLSFGKYNTLEEAHRAVKILGRLAEKQRAKSF